MSKWFKKWYKSPATLAEMKANSQQRYTIDEDLGIGYNLYRGRRSKKNIPNAWDDAPRCIQKTWKEKRKNKYYAVGDKGKKYSVNVNNIVDRYKLEYYFEQNDIIYKVILMERKHKYYYSKFHIIYWSKYEVDVDKILKAPYLYGN